MAAIKVQFTHTPGDWVYTPFGDAGRVEMAALNEDNIEKYYVKRNSESQWFNADELQRAPYGPRPGPWPWPRPSPDPIPGPLPWREPAPGSPAPSGPGDNPPEGAGEDEPPIERMPEEE